MSNMARIILLLFFSLALLVATAKGSEDSPTSITNQIHSLRPRFGAGGRHVDGLSCLSWRVAVETNNIIGWKTIPTACEGYVGHYMLGKEYRKDSQMVTDEAILYAKSLNISKDGKDLWVFDIDETTVSNLPYYAKHGFGVEPFNSTSFDAWVLTGKAPALPETLKLYKKLLSLGIKVIFITGRTEDKRTITTTNMKRVGFHTWDKLLLKGSEYVGKTSVEYKSAQRKKLENKDGYRIIGNIGDQWSDILGTNTGIRTFKLPDPMYYIS